MPDGFSALIDTSNAFFRELGANNTKDWYTPRKDHYTAEIKKPAELLADLLAEDITRLTGVAHKPKVFRIHRDVRFAKDKTPYNTHLHLMWSQPQDARPVWFLGSSPDYLILGMGLMGLQGDTLTRFRNFVDRDGDALSDAIETSGAGLSNWGPAPLKRVPKPFDPDHRHADLLKRKALAIHVDFPCTWRDSGVVATSQSLIKSVLPVWTLMEDAMAQ